MAVQFRDYYETLGVSKTATEDEIKSAFRKLARKHHPDVAKDKKSAEERFKEINEAYEVLSDPDKRQKYDQMGQSYQSWQQAGGQPGGFNWNDWVAANQAAGARGRQGAGQRVTYEDLNEIFGGNSGFSDFFEQFF